MRRYRFRAPQRCTVVLLFALATSPLLAQPFADLVFQEVIDNSSEIFTYREIPIQWKMNGRAQAEFNEGLNNLAEQNPSLAIQNFNAAIKEDKSFWHVYYYRGIAYKQMHLLEDAKKDFKSLIDGDKEHYFSEIELGKIALLEKNLDESDRHFNKARRSSGNDAYARYMKANNHLMRRQIGPAVKGYRECLKLDSTMYNAMVRLSVLTSRKSLTGSIPNLTKVLKRDSLHINALLVRGLANMGDSKTIAVHDFSNVLLKDPNMLLARYLRGIVYSDLSDFDRAFTDFHRLVESMSADENEYTGKQTWTDKKIDVQNLGAYTVSRVYGLSDDDGTALKKAYCLIIADRYNECVSVINKLSIADTEPLCVYLKAIAMEHSKKHKEAFELYSKAITLDKDIVDAYKKRGIYYQETEAYDKSIADFTTVLQMRPKTLIAIKARGVSYYNLKRPKEALSDFNEYLKIDSTDQETYSYRGVAYYDLGQYLNGALDLLKANRPDAINISRLANVIDSTAARGDTLKMISAMNKITSISPAFTEIYALKMQLLIAKGRWDIVNNEIVHAIQRKSNTAKPSSYSYLLTVQGMTKSKLKRYDDAIRLYDNAIDIDKKNALAYLERGKAYADSGKSGKAIADFNKAASLGDKDASELLVRVAAR